MVKSPENHATEVSRKAIDALEMFGATALNSAEKITTLTMGSARCGFDKQMEGVFALMEARSFRDFIALQNTLSKPVLQNALHYYNDAYIIAHESQQELKRLAENGYSEFVESVNTILEKTAKTAPQGSEVAIAAVKSAMNAANSAYDQMSDNAQKASDITRGSIQASTDVASKAIGSMTENVTEKSMPHKK